MATNHSPRQVINLLLIAVFIISLIPVQPGQAAASSSFDLQAGSFDGNDPRLGYDPETGFLNFVGGSREAPLGDHPSGNFDSTEEIRASAEEVLTQYASGFGLKDPARELTLQKVDQDEHGSTLRYQQHYLGIPVLGGEMLVNSDTQGNILSLSGEVSPGLALKTDRPTVSPEEALRTAQNGMQEWYGLTPGDLAPAQPALWIYDERLLGSGTRPAALVWRVELEPVKVLRPINELVLVDATNGKVFEHFNQVTAGEAETTPAGQSQQAFAQQTGTTYYVSNVGSDLNIGITPDSPCATINYVLQFVAPGDTIKVAAGTYPASVQKRIQLANKREITLSGGWDEAFEAQVGFSTLDGENARGGMGTDGCYSYCFSSFTMSNFIITRVAEGDSSLTLINGSFKITNVSIHHNLLSGIVIDGANVTITNTTVSDNISKTTGAGIYIRSHATVTLNNDTITRNILPQATNTGSGLFISSMGVNLTISNSIIAGNDAGGNLDIWSDYSFPLLNSQGYNLLGSFQENGFVDPADTDRIGQPAGLSPFHPSGYYLPLLGSLALDDGSPADPDSEANACTATDQLGQVRPSDSDQDGTARCDTGAIETLPMNSGESLLAWSNQKQTVATGITLLDPPSVLAVDANGAPLAGVPVTFTVLSGPGGTFVDTGAGMTTLKTDKQGIVTAPAFVTSSSSGTTVIEAALDSPSGTKAYFEVQTEIPVPTFIAPVAGSNQTAELNAAFPTRPQVRVFDQFSTPLGGVSVTFTAPGNGPSAVFVGSGIGTGDAVSGADGLATAPELVANGIFGRYELIASISGMSYYARFILVNGDNLYVSLSGWDKNHPYENDCRDPQDPCLTISQALSKGKIGSTIFVTAETFSMYGWFTINIAQVYLSGGWNQNFTEQVGFTKISAGTYRIEKSVDVTLTNFVLRSSGVGGVFQNYGRLDFTNGTFLNYHGAGFTNYANASLTNVTMSGDTSYGINNQGTMFLRNVTITGYKDVAFINDGSLAIQNTIISGNKAICTNTGTITSNGHNLFDQSKACNGYPVSANNGDVFGVDPGLSALVNNQYHALVSGSPAVDQIDPADPDAFCPATDARGLARPVTGKCDIGAYEYTAPGPLDHAVIFSGDNQSFGSGSVLPKRLGIQTLDANGTPLPGIQVIFEIPEYAVGSLFYENWTKRWSATTDESGVGASSWLLNGDDPRSYEVTAWVDGVTRPFVFHITATEATKYVDPVNGNSNSACKRDNPCNTLLHAYLNIKSGEMIKIASGKVDMGFQYNVYPIDEEISISGGWNSSFTERTGQTTIEPLDNIKSNFIFMRNLDINGGNRYPTALLLGTDGISSTFFMMDGAFYNNGVAINNRYGNEVWLTNVTIAENNCNRDEYCNSNGVVINTGKAVHLNHVTIAENHTLNPKNYRLPVLSFPITGTGKVYLQNSLITQNYHNAYLNSDDLPAGENVISFGHNVVDIGNDLQLTPAEGDIFGTRAEWIRAKLNYSQKTTGQSVLLRPLADSPVVDAANGTNCPPHDQQRSLRPAGTQCDIGAVEGVDAGEELTNRMTYIPYAGMNLPGIFRCGSSQSGCTGGEDNEVDSAHRLAAEFDQFMRAYLNRNGVDDHGMPFISTAQYPEEYAFWNGRQAVFGYRYSLGDDLVAHEFAHGINTYTAHLINFYQSGAINESLSDIWAEYYDSHDDEIGETPDDAWLIGEGLPNGALRSMKNPPDYTQPDRMTSSLFKKTYLDNGGVHTNSGVGNKAFYLIVEGGTFNKRVIAPLGWEKAAAIYYYAERYLITSGANYSDLYQALNQSCRVLSDPGAQGITPEDCKQVLNATDAVEMNLEPKTVPTIDANYCPAGRSMNPSNLFYDDFENGDGKWRFGSIIQAPHWSVMPGDVKFYYAASGTHALFGNDYNEYYGEEDQVSDSYAVWKLPVLVPVGMRTYLHFKHAFAFEFSVYRGKNYYFDGGFLEYSIDHGAKWKDATSLRDSGQPYTGSIYYYKYPGHNPSFGKRGFVGDSYGYVSTRYNLSSLAGKSVLFRWRVSTDYTGYRIGWVVDDVRVYDCIINPSAPILAYPRNTLLLNTYQPTLSWKPVDTAVKYELQIAKDQQFNQLVADLIDLTQPGYTFREDLPENSLYYWRVRAVNQIGAEGKWSSVQYFRTRMRPPALAVPANHENWPDLRPEFTWSGVPGAVSYTIAISSTSTFREVLANTVTGTGNNSTKDLPAGKILYWRVRANGKNPSVWSETFDFSTPTPPSIPSPTSPRVNTLVMTYTPQLAWKMSKVPDGAPAFASYRLEIDDNADFSSLLYQKDDLVNNTLVLPIAMPPNSKIFWRVRAQNVNGEYSSWSASYFRTRIQPPNLLVPAEDETVISATPTFDWSDGGGASSYSIVISANPNMSSPLVSTTVRVSTYTPTKALPRGKVLYWWVRANGANGPSAWSEPRQFQIE